MINKKVMFMGPNDVQLVEKPLRPLKAGEVLCKATCSLISIGTETIALRGKFDAGTSWESWVQYPFHPGYDISGEVIAVGEGVENLKVGDHVLAETGHQMYFICDAKYAVKIPEGVTDAEACWGALLRVAQNAVRRAEIKMGDKVVVVGGGQVGQLAIQFARICGASTIVAVDTLERRAEFSRKSGATHVVTGLIGDVGDQIRACCGGKSPDIIIEATGNPLVLAPCCSLVRKYGKIVLVGDTPDPSRQALGPGVVSNSVAILGVHGSCIADHDNPYYPFTWDKVHEISLGYMADGRLKMAEMITHVCTPREVPAMYERLMADKSFANGILIDWTKA